MGAHLHPGQGDSPALRRYEYQRAGSRTVQVAAAHVAMISHPGVVTDLIMDAANATS
jgi:hypothetical protein